MKIYDLIDEVLLDNMIKSGYISVSEYNGFRIYNYTRSCSFEHVWNDATEQCRGLITNSVGDIISRPFRKFYNYEELVGLGVKIPNLPYEVFDKKDGSLGIMWWDDECHPHIATRGSFTGEQATWATNFLLNNVIDIDDEADLRELVLDFVSGDGDTPDRLIRVRKTLLFEIVYPEDRHIVDYGDERSLTLLAVIDNETGKDDDPYLFSKYFDVIRRYDGVKDWRTIREIFAQDNAEGFVVRFSNGFRMKLKFQSWFESNRMMSGLSERRVLEFLADNLLPELCEKIALLNEENRFYYKKMIKNLYDTYRDIEITTLMQYRDDFENDKEAAEYFKKCENSDILFAVRRGKDYSANLWRKIKKTIKEDINDD